MQERTHFLVSAVSMVDENLTVEMSESGDGGQRMWDMYHPLGIYI